MQEVTLEQLYEMQKALDERIIRDKRLEGLNLLQNTVLALQLEIAELANEWRGFKHWSNDREPRTKVEVGYCFVCNGDGRLFYPNIKETECPNCAGEGRQYKNPLLEEYVDSYHLFLSLARQLGFKPNDLQTTWDEPTEDTIRLFIDLLTATGLSDYTDIDAFNDAWIIFNQVGERLGFTWEQITAAYIAKNQVNHERQINGY